MPNSFSRFLSPDELAKVREVYLKSIEDFEGESSSSEEEAAVEEKEQDPTPVDAKS